MTSNGANPDEDKKSLFSRFKRRMTQSPASETPSQSQVYEGAVKHATSGGSQQPPAARPIPKSNSGDNGGFAGGSTSTDRITKTTSEIPSASNRSSAAGPQTTTSHSAVSDPLPTKNSTPSTPAPFKKIDAPIRTTGSELEGRGSGSAAVQQARDTKDVQAASKSATTTTTNTTRSAFVDKTDLDRSDKYWILSEDATEAARQQALLVEQATVTTVEIRTKLTEAEHSLNETKRSRTLVQGRVTGLDLDRKRKEYDAALKDFNRAQAFVPTLSDEFSRSQAEAEALKLGVQEKGAALEKEIIARDAAMLRLGELRTQQEGGQDKLAQTKDLLHRRSAELESLKTKQGSLEAGVADSEMEMQKVTAEYEALSEREAELAAAIEEQRRLHANLAASLLVANDLATNHTKEFEACKTELEPLPIHHTELLALCEDDQAKVVLLDRETQLAIEEAEALMIETERRAAELAEIQTRVEDLERAFHGRYNAQITAEEEAVTLEDSAREYKLAAEQAEVRAAELSVTLRECLERVETAQALKEEYWVQAKLHGEKGEQISGRHFIQLNEGFPGGGDISDMLKPSERTARIYKQGNSYKDAEETHVISDDATEDSVEKSGHDFEESKRVLQ